MKKTLQQNEKQLSDLTKKITVCEITFFVVAKSTNQLSPVAGHRNTPKL